MASSYPGTVIEAYRIDHDAFRYYQRLERVKRYLERHYAGDVTLAAAARVACLEEKYFSHFFHQKTGMRFAAFVSFMRVEQAKHLLCHRDTAIATVAQQVGYQNPRTFERAFKKWTGVTARGFRKRARAS